MTVTKNQDLLLYLQICADAYGENLAEKNKLDFSWQKLKLVFNNVVSEKEYYGFDEKNGFDAAIYYNERTNEVIVGIRGTEALSNDGDVSESANILNHSDKLTQFGELNAFHQVIQATIASIGYTGTYKVVGQSLGGALASVYAGLYTTEVSEAITINPIGVAYNFPQNQKVTNYLVMNDIFSMLNYDQQIGKVKLVSRLGGVKCNPTSTGTLFKTELKFAA